MNRAHKEHPKTSFIRIFVRTNFMTMDNQYCKVGAVTPITSGHHAVAVLEYRYNNFLQKASDSNIADSRLVEFFENKAHQLKKVLENLVQ